MKLKKISLLFLMFFLSIILVGCSATYLNLNPENTTKIVVCNNGNGDDELATIDKDNEHFSFAIETLNSIKFEKRKKRYKCISRYMFKVYYNDGSHDVVRDSAIWKYNSNYVLIKEIRKITDITLMNFKAESLLDLINGI